MMEEPQSALASHQIESLRPRQERTHTGSESTSPEHSRARSKTTRTTDQSSRIDLGCQPRRREGHGDGTRRGRSCTRSVSPVSAKQRALRRRRSRSPSRSRSSSATDTQSSNTKRQRPSHNDYGSDENFKGGPEELVVRDGSRESMRSRSKRRKKYRRRSDYAAAAADGAWDTNLATLRLVNASGRTNTNGEAPSVGGLYDRNRSSFESVTEEDEQ